MIDIKVKGFQEFYRFDRKPEADDDLEQKQKHLTAITEEIDDDIQKCKKKQETSLNAHQNQFNTQVFSAKNTTTDELDKALLANEENKLAAITDAMQLAFVNAIHAVRDNPVDFSQLQQQIIVGYNAIINEFEERLKRKESPIKAQEILDAQLSKLRNVIDYGYPPAVQGFTQLISPENPYYEPSRLAVMAINGSLNEIDKKARVLAQNVVDNVGTETANNFLSVFRGELKTEVEEAFNKDSDISQQHEELKHFFTGALKGYENQILSIAQDTKKSPEKKKFELSELYENIAKAAYAKSHDYYRIQWDEVADAAKTAAEKDYEQFHEELKQHHIQKIKKLNEVSQKTGVITLSIGDTIEKATLEPNKEYNISKAGNAKVTVGADGTSLTLSAYFPGSTYSITENSRKLNSRKLNKFVELWQMAMFDASPAALIGRQLLNSKNNSQDNYKIQSAIVDVQDSIPTLKALLVPGTPITVASSDPEITKMLTRKLEMEGLWVIGGSSQFEWNPAPPSKIKQAANAVGKLVGNVAGSVAKSLPVSTLNVPALLDKKDSSAQPATSRNEDAYQAARKKGLGLGPTLTKALDLPPEDSKNVEPLKIKTI